MQDYLNSILLTVIAALLGIILNYLKKMVANYDSLRDKVSQHETRIVVLEKSID